MKNKKLIIALVACLTISCSNSFAKDLDSDIKEAQNMWADAKYLQNKKSDKLSKFKECEKFAENLVAQYPKNAEPIIWQGICAASQCNILKLSALSKAKQAKEIFEKARAIDDKALDGSSYTNLGVLYHRVPGWPIGFGDNELAEENFIKALEIAPHNIDANYFYALLLIDEDREDQAMTYLNIAAKAPSRNRPLADAKRKEEVAELQLQLQKK